MDKLFLITASYDHGIRFWETTTKKIIRNIPYPESVRKKNYINLDCHILLPLTKSK